ncbi:MAG: GNAT family N-acetyltransferase [Phycisphaeraceae bacterium]|nr:GNAT family N-acetyltransferase [Phycisphaeraceae bacterium]
MTPTSSASVFVRNTQAGDVDQIIDLCRRVYTTSMPWTEVQLHSHLSIFPQGQFVAIDSADNKVVGMASSLVVLWDDYEVNDNWRDFTDSGMFTNHDPEGHTLYGAEVMVDPTRQGKGIGKKIYAARRELTRSMGLLRIRAGARLRGYGKFKQQMSPEDYVLKVIRRDIGDPTLSFQLKQGFRVLGVVRDYLHHDEESMGHAALIEWVNHQLAARKDTYGRDPKFGKPRKKEDI